jgi:hypothetical protein
VATPANAARVAPFLETLQHVLPCVYCRDSYVGFFAELEQQHGDTTSVVARGDLNKWMFDLHEKVNIKLDMQTTINALKDAGVDTEKMPPPQPICRKRQLTFECLQKRFAVRKVQYSSTDVWDLLLIFMLNLDDVRAEGEQLPEARAAGYATFMRLLPAMVNFSCGAQSSPAANQFCAAIAELASSYDAALAQQARAPQDSVLFKWVLHARARYDDMRYTNEYEADMLYRYGLARAGACMHGSCQ